jgi:hypothetical protein
MLEVALTHPLIEAVAGDRRAWTGEAFTNRTYIFAIEGSRVGFVESLQFFTDLLKAAHCKALEMIVFCFILTEIGPASRMLTRRRPIAIRRAANPSSAQS